jgi:ferric-dicitrate binding protein FerR (iron transport regulator)
MQSPNNIDLLNSFLDGKATTNEVKHLLGELENSEFESEWLGARWGEASDEINPAVKKKIFENIKQETSPQRFSIRKNWMSIAAAILLICTTSLSGYLLYNSTKNTQIEDMVVAVEKGQKATITLPDGSRVWMNSGSKLTYGRRFNQNERVIHLEGEAYFDVAKKKNAPFIVQSGEFSVEALGTAFDVKAYPEEKLITAVLVRGKIEVGDERNKMRLIPNQCVVYDKSIRSMQKTEVDNPKLYTSWMNNQLVFESESFDKIAVLLERNYNIKFAFEDRSLKKYRFTGTIGNTSLESLLQIFSMTSPFSYSIKDSVIMLKVNKETMPYYKRATGQ